MSEPAHIPVLLEATLEYLNVRPGGVIVDATLGLGGHSSEIAKRLGGAGKLICFDRDSQAMQQANRRFEKLATELGISKSYVGKLAPMEQPIVTD